MQDLTERNSGRQYALSAVMEFGPSLADAQQLPLGEVAKVFALPAGAVITDVILQVRTAFNDTTPVISVGRYSHNASDPDNFLDAVSLGTGDSTFQTSLSSADEEAALDNADDNHVDVPNDSIAVLYANASGTATAGAATLIVRYVVRGRDQENQG